jgi:hypothetical protein
MPSGIGDFTEIRQLGQGVSGVCRLVRRNADQRLYALKELDLPTERVARALARPAHATPLRVPPQPPATSHPLARAAPRSQGEANAVLQEVHILASLEHPFIVRYYDSFLDTRKLFLVMEYAPNGSLHSALTNHQKTQRPLAEDTVWRYMLQLLLGLHAIHTNHIVHRDIKPHNIFLSADDSVKIGDFGVSRMLSGSADLATTLVGSPGYLAPELCSGEPYNEKADIWALGVTLVELCALKHPFGGAGSQAALVMKIMGHTSPPPLPPTFSAPLSRVLATCMARHAAHRPSALQLLSVPLVYQKAVQHNLQQLVPPQAARHAQHIASGGSGGLGGGGSSLGGGAGGLGGGSGGLGAAAAPLPSQPPTQPPGGPRPFGARVGVSSSLTAGGPTAGGGGAGVGAGTTSSSMDADRYAAAAAAAAAGGGGGGCGSARVYEAPSRGPASGAAAPFQPLPFQRQQPPRSHAQRRAGASSNCLPGVHEDESWGGAAGGGGGGGHVGGSAAAAAGALPRGAGAGAGGNSGACSNSGAGGSGGSGSGSSSGGFHSSCNGSHASHGTAKGYSTERLDVPRQLGTTRETPSGVSWSIKPVCADCAHHNVSMRSSSMRKSWHALNYPTGGAAASSTSSSFGGGDPAPPEAQQQQPFVPRVGSHESVVVGVVVPSRSASDPHSHSQQRSASDPHSHSQQRSASDPPLGPTQHPHSHSHSHSQQPPHHAPSQYAPPQHADVQRTRRQAETGPISSPLRAPTGAGGPPGAGGAPGAGGRYTGLAEAHNGSARAPHLRVAAGEGDGPPSTPPSAATLWAKRRGADASPGSQADLNLQLISIKGNDQWQVVTSLDAPLSAFECTLMVSDCLPHQELQSPLDVFARKHCPSRSRLGASSSGPGGEAGPAALNRPHPLLCETDEEGPGSPLWDRPNNHSPLAALLRREFPTGKPQSERRLFDDL